MKISKTKHITKKGVVKKNPNKRIWYVIVFIDGNEEHYHREEIIDKNGDVIGYGEPKYFRTKSEAQKFLNNLDSREFDRYIKEVFMR